MCDFFVKKTSFARVEQIHKELLKTKPSKISYALNVVGFSFRIGFRSLQKKAFHFSQMRQHVTPLHTHCDELI